MRSHTGAGASVARSPEVSGQAQTLGGVLRRAARRRTLHRSFLFFFRRWLASASRWASAAHPSGTACLCSRPALTRRCPLHTFLREAFDPLVADRPKGEQPEGVSLPILGTVASGLTAARAAPGERDLPARPNMLRPTRPAATFVVTLRSLLAAASSRLVAHLLWPLLGLT